MLMRSTGLGKTELSGRISGLVRHQDYLVLQVETVQPVKWKIRVAIARPDIWQVIKGILKWENMKVVLLHEVEGGAGAPRRVLAVSGAAGRGIGTARLRRRDPAGGRERKAQDAVGDDPPS